MRNSCASTSRRCLLFGAAALAALPARRAHADDAAFTGFPGSVVRFASEADARRLLAVDDEWMQAASPWQRRAVLRSDAPVDRATYASWNADAARSWTGEAGERWRVALSTLAPRWAALRIALPPQVWLVATNGQESAGAPYTRGAFVVLPQPTSFPPAADVFVLAHELWHVASRHDPALASRLYALIGFEPIPPLVFPEAWAPIRLANPDAPEHRHAMRLEIEGRERLVTPLVVARRTTLEPGETFFSVLESRLVEVEIDGAVSRAVLRDGQPLWHALDALPGYRQRLGGNTGYVMHPEETLADNLALLLAERPVRNPELLARLRAELLRR